MNAEIEKAHCATCWRAGSNSRALLFSPTSPLRLLNASHSIDGSAPFFAVRACVLAGGGGDGAHHHHLH